MISTARGTGLGWWGSDAWLGYTGLYPPLSIKSAAERGMAGPSAAMALHHPLAGDMGASTGLGWPRWLDDLRASGESLGDILNPFHEIDAINSRSDLTIRDRADLSQSENDRIDAVVSAGLARQEAADMRATLIKIAAFVGLGLAGLYVARKVFS